MLLDPAYLRTDQYSDASNLKARIQLHERFSTNPYRWHRWVFDQLELSATSRVLELGCGPGLLWLENIDRIPPGWDITLSDFSQGMLEDARRDLRNSAQRFRFEVSDAQVVPFPQGCFDTVIANHMLYHVPDRSKAFAEIRRVLKSNGRFYAATNGRIHMRELDELVNRFGIDTSFSFGKLFGLENGGEQLAHWFTDIAMRRYEDALEITEPEPLIIYTLSGSLRSRLDDATLSELRNAVSQEIATRRAFHITKDAGLFIAGKST